MIKRKVYVVGGRGYYEYTNWLECEVVSNMEDADVVLFAGGSDVSPELYKKRGHSTTHCDPARDRYELGEFNKARELNKKMIGICRGLQFLICMAGGKLIQDSYHPYLHPVITNDGRTFTMTSTHHQQGYIKDMKSDDVILLGWSENLSPYHSGESDEDDMTTDKEVEVVYLTKIKALCLQSHPEYIFGGKEKWQEEYIAYCRELADTYLS